MKTNSITFSGIIKKYTGTGRKLGYPTANIEIDDETDEGVFVGYASLPGSGELPALIFIGKPLTIAQNGKRLEAHILDFPDKDLYGERIDVSVLKKIRDNRKFDSVDKLIQKMKNDELKARNYFNLPSDA